MAEITLKGNKIHTVGDLPNKGIKAEAFTLTKNDLSKASLSDYAGSRVILNIFPSLETGICATSIREFNKMASNLDNTKVLCISKDLPFTQAKFCGAEGLENVETLSDFGTGDFGKKYGVEIADGPMQNLLSRAVVVLNEEGVVTYTQQVPEIAQEPDYESVLKVLA